MNEKNLARVLIVDDEKNFTDGIASLLGDYDFECFVAYNGRDALNVLKEKKIDVMITDLLMPEIDGIELLKRVRVQYPNIQSIVMTAHGGQKENKIVRELGAKNFILKPIDVDQLANMIDGMYENKDLKDERDFLLERLKRNETEKKIENIIGKSAKTQSLLSTIMTVAPTNLSILITGESGVGKQLVAESIHSVSLRSSKPFVDTHCAAFADTLLEDELFGHEKGAFTGASTARKGIFEKANGGTLFLDEIGEISLSTQVKLLKVLEEKKFIPLGGSREIESDFRLICATNRDLEEEVRKKNFREDLFYRINKMNIYVPPLRERGNDIVLLSNDFLKKFAKEYNKDVELISTDAMDLLCSYSWPGNVRELENTIEASLVMSRGKEITVNDLPYKIRNTKSEKASSQKRDDNDDEITVHISSLEDMESQIINKMLEKNSNNKTKVAQILGINRKTLSKKVEK